MLLSKLESNLLLKFKLTNFFPNWITWFLLETSIFWPSVSFHSSRIFLLKKSFISFSYNFNETWDNNWKKNKKKQLENPFRKSSNSQLWTKYWSWLTFLIDISLHSSKAWGRLTLIETTSIIRIFLFFCVPIFDSCTLKLTTEANMLRNICSFWCTNYFLILCPLATILIVFNFASRQL